MLVGGVAAAAAIAMGLPPFDRILATFDPAWRELVRTGSGYLFVQDWVEPGPRRRRVFDPGLDSGRDALQWRASASICVRRGLGCAGRPGDGHGSDWLGSVIVTQLQPWRALWISTLATAAGLGLLIARGPDASREDWIAIAGGVSGSLLGVTAGPLVTAASIALLIGYRFATRPEVKRLLLLAAALMFAQAMAWYVLNRHFEWLREEVFAQHDLDIAGLSSRSSAALDSRDCGRSGLGPLAGTRFACQFGSDGSDRAAGGRYGMDKGLWGGRRDSQTIPGSPGDTFAAARGYERLLERRCVDTLACPRSPKLPVGRTDCGDRVLARHGDGSQTRGRLVEAILGPQDTWGCRKSREAGSVQKSLDSPEAVGLCADPELGGVYVSGTSELVRAAVYMTTGKGIRSIRVLQ